MAVDNVVGVKTLFLAMVYFHTNHLIVDVSKFEDYDMNFTTVKQVGKVALAISLVTGAAFSALSTTAVADETCQSPYMAKIVGQEDFVYVWTLGVEGVGDGQDKLVTVDVNPKSKHYGKVVNSLSVGGRNEAHHSGFTDDRRYLWAGGLDTNKIFVFDVFSDPGKPKLHHVVTDFVAKSGGVVGPHTTYALPGRMMITGLSNNKDHGGRTALVEYSNDGKFIATHWMPTDANLHGAEKAGKFADGYGYDVRAFPKDLALRFHLLKHCLASLRRVFNGLTLGCFSIPIR